eukprot:Selendium_serpulae@DN6182_c2_g5_i2.p2
MMSSTTKRRTTPFLSNIVGITCVDLPAPLLYLREPFSPQKNGISTVAQFDWLTRTTWFKKQTEVIFDVAEVKELRDKLFHIRPVHHNFVQHVLNKAGFEENKFSMIHWRSERAEEQHMVCAKHLVPIIRFMQTNVTRDEKGQPFLIASQVHRDAKLSWNGHKKRREAINALNFLMKQDNSFLQVRGFHEPTRPQIPRQDI